MRRGAGEDPVAVAREKWDALLQHCDEAHILQMMLLAFTRDIEVMVAAMGADAEEARHD